MQLAFIRSHQYNIVRKCESILTLWRVVGCLATDNLEPNTIHFVNLVTILGVLRIRDCTIPRYTRSWFIYRSAWAASFVPGVRIDIFVTLETSQLILLSSQQKTKKKEKENKTERAHTLARWAETVLFGDSDISVRWSLGSRKAGNSREGQERELDKMHGELNCRLILV